LLEENRYRENENIKLNKGDFMMPLQFWIGLVIFVLVACIYWVVKDIIESHKEQKEEAKYYEQPVTVSFNINSIYCGDGSYTFKDYWEYSCNVQAGGKLIYIPSLKYFIPIDNNITKISMKTPPSDDYHRENITVYFNSPIKSKEGSFDFSLDANRYFFGSGRLIIISGEDKILIPLWNIRHISSNGLVWL